MCSREICKICYHVNPIGFIVPDDIWQQIVPQWSQNTVICLSCFTRLGDEKQIQWDKDIEFFPISLYTHLGENVDKIPEEIKEHGIKNV